LNHFTGSTGAVELLPVRADAGDGRGEFLWASVLVSLLASRVFEVFGLDTGRIDTLTINMLPEFPEDSPQLPPHQPPDFPRRNAAPDGS
jgi:hypothetical protein